MSRIVVCLLALTAFASAQEKTVKDRVKEVATAQTEQDQLLKAAQERLVAAEAQYTRLEKAYAKDGRPPSREKVVFTMHRLEKATSRRVQNETLGELESRGSLWQGVADEISVELDEAEAAEKRDKGRERQLRSLRTEVEKVVETIQEIALAQRQIYETKRRSFILLRRKNLFMKGTSTITAAALKEGFGDLKQLPAWAGRTVADTGRGGWLSLLLGVGIAVAAAWRLRRRYRLTLLLLAVPVLASFLLTELPEGASDWLRAMGLVFGGFVLLRGLHPGLSALCWISVVLLPFLIGLETFGYANQGMREFCWLVYEALVGFVVVITVLRGQLLQLLPRNSLLQSLVRWVQPLLVLAVPALLILDALSYDVIAALLTRTFAGALAGVVVASLAQRFGRTLVEKRFTRRAALDGARFLVGWLAFGLGVEIFLRVAGSDLDEVRSFLNVPLPLLSTVTYWKLLIGTILMVFFLTGTGRAKAVLRDVVLARSKVSVGLQYTLTQLFGYVVVALGVYVAVNQVLDLSSLGYIVAALSVGLGFGMQEIVSNFVSGLILLFERPLRVGDMIEVGGIRGEVRQINIRATTVLTQDNVYLLVPNREFIAQTVINNGHVDPKMRVHVPVGVSYGSDVPLVRSVLEQVASEHGRVLKRPESEVRFVSFGESSIDFELLCWIQHAPDRDRIKSDLTFSIFEKFAEHGIQIPFPQRDLHIRSGLHPAPEVDTVPAAGDAPDDAEG